MFGRSKACVPDRVLIVDDDGTTRLLYATILTESIPNLKTDVAADGSEAIKSFESNRQGVLILDHHMPGKDGLSTYLEIDALCKKNGWLPPCCIFCTAYAAPEAFSDVVRDKSRHDVIEKPLISAQLIESVEKRLAIIRGENK